ncbi:hypothetical protein BJ912DRAFT_5199 [Pholiota molesta]|nr:hypothetical protein BJ912DRAFT_5199 [Pholiota molesta]
MGHDYEFIKTRTTRYSSYLSQAVDLPLEDLESDSVTRMVDEGLMLWSSEGDGTDMVAADADAEVRTPMMSSTGNIKVETDDAVLRAADATDMDQHHHEHSTDEDAVEFRRVVAILMAYMKQFCIYVDRIS